MSSFFRKSLLTLFAGAALLTAGTVMPAAAWDDRGDRGWRSDRSDGWHRDEWRHRPHWRGERCWIEERRVRVYTPWGPRLRRVEERVCR